MQDWLRPGGKLFISEYCFRGGERGGMFVSLRHYGKVCVYWADTPKLFFFRKKTPRRALLLQEGHLHLTASQGSFPENSFFAVETKKSPTWSLLKEEVFGCLGWSYPVPTTSGSRPFISFHCCDKNTSTAEYHRNQRPDPYQPLRYHRYMYWKPVSKISWRSNETPSLCGR